MARDPGCVGPLKRSSAIWEETLSVLIPDVMSAPGALDSDSNQSLNSLIIQNLLTPTRIGKLLKYLPMMSSMIAQKCAHVSWKLDSAVLMEGQIRVARSSSHPLYTEYETSFLLSLSRT